MWMPVPTSSLVEITVQRGTAVVDRYNAERLDFTAPAQRVLVGYVQERQVDESSTDTQSMSVDMTAWLPYDADVLSTDRVIVHGQAMRVVAVKRLAFGSFRHSEVGLIREDTP